VPVLRHLRLRISAPKPRNRLVSATALLGASAGSTLAGALLLAAGGMPGGPATLAFAAAPPAPGHVAYNAKAHASQPVVITQASVSPFETVATGDTLSSISAARCGTAADWSGIFYANHPPLRDPDSIAVGQVLRIDCSDPGYTYPKPKIVRTVQQSVQTDSAPASTTAQDAPTVQRQAPVARYGVLTEAQIGVLWLDAGGPAWAEGQAERIVRGELVLDPSRHQCTWKGKEVHLTVTEFLLLKSLAERPGHVKNRDQLMDAAYGETIYVDDRTIDSHIKRVRRKFREVDPEFEQIETLYGIGYRYRDS